MAFDFQQKVSMSKWKESVPGVVVVHEELLGEHVPAGVGVEVGVALQQLADDVHVDTRVQVLQLLDSGLVSIVSYSRPRPSLMILA